VRLANLADIRTHKRITQGRLATPVGVSQPRISVIEHGLNVGCASAEKIARVPWM